MTDILGAIRHLGKCLREGREMYMGVPAENVCIGAADEIERLTKERQLALANADAVYAKLMPENERLRAALQDAADSLSEVGYFNRAREVLDAINQQSPPKAWLEAKKEVDEGWPDK